jgi:hypothetical protein
MDPTHTNARQHPAAITKAMLIYQRIRKSEHSLVYEDIYLSNKTTNVMQLGAIVFIIP